MRVQMLHSNSYVPNFASAEGACPTIQAFEEMKTVCLAVNPYLLKDSIASEAHYELTGFSFDSNPDIFEGIFTLQIRPDISIIPILYTTLVDQGKIEQAKALIASEKSNAYLTSPPVPLRLIARWSQPSPKQFPGEPVVEVVTFMRSATLRDIIKTVLALKAAAEKEGKGGWKKEKPTWRWDAEGAARKRNASSEVKEAAALMFNNPRAYFYRIGQGTVTDETAVEVGDEETKQDDSKEEVGKGGD